MFVPTLQMKRNSVSGSSRSGCGRRQWRLAETSRRECNHDSILPARADDSFLLSGDERTLHDILYDVVTSWCRDEWYDVKAYTLDNMTVMSARSCLPRL